VTGPNSLLQELSELLGVEIADVELWDRRGRRTWLIERAAEPGWWQHVDARRIRTSDGLAHAVARLSRYEAWRHFTRDDRRRALRLMHEHVENKKQNNTSINAGEQT
jgi:hypothetical protein